MGHQYFTEKAKTLGICPGFSGTVPIAQFQKCHVSLTPKFTSTGYFPCHKQLISYHMETLKVVFYCQPILG